MSIPDHHDHGRTLWLASSAIDGTLTVDEAAELQAGLAACPTCARSAAAMRADAAALSQPLSIMPRRHVDDSVLGAIARRSVWPQRPVLLIAAALVLLAVLGAVAVGAYLQRKDGGLPTAVLPTPTTDSALDSPNPSGLTLSPLPTSPISSSNTGPQPTPSSPSRSAPPRATIPVASGDVQIAPGRDGGLYVLISGSDPKAGTILALLDATGRPRPGWPIVVEGVRTCGPPLPVDDGSVRLVCAYALPESELGVFLATRAVAFDSNGRSLANWPVVPDLGFGATGRIVGSDLTIPTYPSTDVDACGTEFLPSGLIVTIAADGAVREGVRGPLVPECDAGQSPSIGPDGTVYGVTYQPDPHTHSPGEVGTQLHASNNVGVVPGWPVAIGGVTSWPDFDAAGRIYLIEGSPHAGSSRTIVLDQVGHIVPIGSPDLSMSAAPGSYLPGGDDTPAPPVVADDGTSFVLSDDGGTTVVGLDPTGQIMAGWPYRTRAGLQHTGSCAGGDTPCGAGRSVPAIGPGNVLYLPLAARDSKTGGSIVAVGTDGRLISGWPVTLTRRGSEFWSVVAGTDGTVYALAIEPESGGRESATILAIDPDSTVRYHTTVVEP